MTITLKITLLDNIIHIIIMLCSYHLQNVYIATHCMYYSGTILIWTPCIEPDSEVLIKLHNISYVLQWNLDTIEPD